MLHKLFCAELRVRLLFFVFFFPLLRLRLMLFLSFAFVNGTQELWIIQSVIKQLFKLETRKIGKARACASFQTEDEARPVERKKISSLTVEKHKQIYGVKCLVLMWGENSDKLGSSMGHFHDSLHQASGCDP